jgi:hypothetical protein
MSGNVQLYLTEAGLALTRMAAPLSAIAPGVKAGRGGWPARLSGKICSGG